jgi:hypothetical protein
MYFGRRQPMPSFNQYRYSEWSILLFAPHFSQAIRFAHHLAGGRWCARRRAATAVPATLLDAALDLFNQIGILGMLQTRSFAPHPVLFSQ